MKTIILALLLFSSVARAGDGFSFSQTDKVAHFAFSYGISYTGYSMFVKFGIEPWPAFMMSYMGTLLIGILKEFAFDSYASEGDLIADALGGALPIVPIFVFELGLPPEPTPKKEKPRDNNGLPDLLSN